MPSDKDSQQSAPSDSTDPTKRAETRIQEVRMSITPFGHGTFKVSAIHDPDSPCNIVSTSFLKHIKCLEEMKPEPAAHNFGSRPHDRVGVFSHRIRLVSKAGKTYLAIFCVIADDEVEEHVVCLGKNALPDEAPASPGHPVKEGQPVCPILPGHESQEDRKAREERSRKRKQDDEDMKIEQSERNKKARKEGADGNGQPETGQGS